MYNYETNSNRFELLRLKLQLLMSVRGHNYEAHIANGASDPVNEVVNKRIETEKKLNRLEQYILPVKKLYEGLKTDSRSQKDLRELMTRRYLNHERAKETQKELKISPATYWRRTHELMRQARKYFEETDKKEAVESPLCFECFSSLSVNSDDT